MALWITYGIRFIAVEGLWRLPFVLQMFPGFALGGSLLLALLPSMADLERS